MVCFSSILLQAHSLLNHLNSVTCDNNNEDMLVDIQAMFNIDEEDNDVRAWEHKSFFKIIDNNN